MSPAEVKCAENSNARAGIRAGKVFIRRVRGFLRRKDKLFLPGSFGKGWKKLNGMRQKFA